MKRLLRFKDRMNRAAFALGVARTYESFFSVPRHMHRRKGIVVLIYQDSVFVDLTKELKEFFRRRDIEYRWSWKDSSWAPRLIFRCQRDLDLYCGAVEAFERAYRVNGTAKNRIKAWLAENDIIHTWEQTWKPCSNFRANGYGDWVEGDLHLFSDADAVEMALRFNVHRRESTERYPSTAGKYFYVGLPVEESEYS